MRIQNRLRSVLRLKMLQTKARMERWRRDRRQITRHKKRLKVMRIRKQASLGSYA